MTNTDKKENKMLNFEVRIKTAVFFVCFTNEMYFFEVQFFHMNKKERGRELVVPNVKLGNFVVI